MYVIWPKERSYSLQLVNQTVMWKQLFYPDTLTETTVEKLVYRFKEKEKHQQIHNLLKIKNFESQSRKFQSDFWPKFTTFDFWSSESSEDFWRPRIHSKRWVSSQGIWCGKCDLNALIMQAVASSFFKSIKSPFGSPDGHNNSNRLFVFDKVKFQVSRFNLIPITY